VNLCVRSLIAAVALATQCGLPVQGANADPLLPSDTYLSPSALCATRDGKALFMACATANLILSFDTVDRRIVDSIAVPASPSGLALSHDETRLFVTCAAPESKVCILSLCPPEPMHGSKALGAGFRMVATISTGHTSQAPAPSPDGKTLYVCNRFNNDVSVIDLAARKEVRRIPVRREPIAAAITPDGRFLLVANHLHDGRADQEHVAAVVSVIELAAGKVVKELPLPNGSGVLKDIRISPDGRYAAVSHIVARFNRPTTRLYYGWMNSNALTLIDLAQMEVAKTLILDDPYSGAANPWGVGWSSDSRIVVIAHAGTHEVTVLGLPSSLDGLPGLSLSPDPAQADGSGYMPFFFGSRRRIRLPGSDLGPRAVAVVGHTAYVANYFSDTLTAINITPASSVPARSPSSLGAGSSPSPPREERAGERRPSSPGTLKAESIPLGPKREMSPVRKGEFYFHDATICFEGWWSCSSCHPGDARADGLNWDLLNDGIGNPKNTKSLLLAFQTPPAMWLGVRETAETAVRAGLKHILFTQQPEEVAAATDAYLKSLKPVLSPYLVQSPKSKVQSRKAGDGWSLSAAAQRGKAVFARAGCAACHPPPLFTNLHQYDVGTSRPFDRPTDRFDTPTLIELWRTAPYLHDGSAATVRDVLTIRNPHNQHGKTSDLTSQQINDLCCYLLSL
jgi:YVTN family beta-propeller protein